MAASGQGILTASRQGNMAAKVQGILTASGR